MSPAYGCRGPAFPPSPGGQEIFEVYLLCGPLGDDLCQSFPHLSTSWLSPSEPIQTWVVEVPFNELLENLTFRWEIPEVPDGVSLWLLDPARETETNIVNPFSPEHAVPMDFDGTTSFVICSYWTVDVQKSQCLPHAAVSGFD